MKIIRNGITVDGGKTVSKHQAYRARHREEYRAKDRTRKQAFRAAAIPEFIGVDSEGIGRGKNHRAVLLGVGKEQYVARDLSKGLQWQEVFRFLYDQFEQHPKAAFVGFYLKYDFTEWLKSLPQQTAWLLISSRGRALRRMKGEHLFRRQYHPARTDDWEIDLLGFKRLSIRPRVCRCAENKMKCEHEQMPWMHICDAGPFFQDSFLNTINPEKWKEPVCTPEEYTKVETGKNKRATGRLNAEMKFYNQLENEILARVMGRLAKGFIDIGVRLGKDQWYGPGAAAQKWLSQNGALKHDEAIKHIPEWFLDICRMSYYGGWFEIFSHGLIEGSSWNYDINSAYPHAARKLPHICGECQFRRGHGHHKGSASNVLLLATVFAANTRIGPVPYRDKDGSILRPDVCKGWYWASELEASQRAGLVKKYITHEWAEFIPCSHPKPFTELQSLYDQRKNVFGKDTAQGMAVKLLINSIYGKFAQSVGSAPYNNWLYASYITAHCRTQILDAIATHPGKSDSVLMVATDGIAFDSPHPNIPISKELGEWDNTEYIDLCLFKPGVYWHREGKEALLKIKSRGVPKKEFAEGVDDMEKIFRMMHDLKTHPGAEWFKENVYQEFNEERLTYTLIGSRGWPHFLVPVNFRMKSCQQALNEGDWNRAGVVQETAWILQDSDPQNKRRSPTYNRQKRRIDTFIHHLPAAQRETTYYGNAVYPPHANIGVGIDGDAIDVLLEAGAALREKPANYDLPIDENEYDWVTIWDGGPV